MRLLRAVDMFLNEKWRNDHFELIAFFITIIIIYKLCDTVQNNIFQLNLDFFYYIYYITSFFYI